MRIRRRDLRDLPYRLGTEMPPHLNDRDRAPPHPPSRRASKLRFFPRAFPTLCPTGIANWLQPCLKTVRLHEYGLHLLKYCDQRFGKHLRFQYFVLNMIMRHRSQGIVAVFVKKTLKREYLQQLKICVRISLNSQTLY